MTLDKIDSKPIRLMFKGKDGRDYPTIEALREADRTYIELHFLKEEGRKYQDSSRTDKFRPGDEPMYIGKDGRDYPTLELLTEANRLYWEIRSPIIEDRSYLFNRYPPKQEITDLSLSRPTIEKGHFCLGCGQEVPAHKYDLHRGACIAEQQSRKTGRDDKKLVTQFEIREIQKNDFIPKPKLPIVK